MRRVGKYIGADHGSGRSEALPLNVALDDDGTFENGKTYGSKGKQDGRAPRRAARRRTSPTRRARTRRWHSSTNSSSSPPPSARLRPATKSDHSLNNHRVQSRPRETTSREIGTMSAPFIYVGTYEVSEGRFDEARQSLAEAVEFIETNEPRMISFNIYGDEDAGTMSIIQVHADSASMDFHMKLVAEHVGGAALSPTWGRRSEPVFRGRSLDSRHDPLLCRPRCRVGCGSSAHWGVHPHGSSELGDSSGWEAMVTCESGSPLRIVVR